MTTKQIATLTLMLLTGLAHGESFVIKDTILASYNEDLVYTWPGDRFVGTKTLWFGTHDDMSGINKGESHCFTLEEIAPIEVCGVVKNVVKWEASYWVSVLVP